MLKYVQDTSFDTEFGVKSVNDSLLLDSKSTLTKRNSITTTSLLKDGTSHFRIIICGDSGIGKSALVHALSTADNSDNTTRANPPSSFEPTEYFLPSTDICVVDTCGYGASIRPDTIFSNTKNYLEKQFEKTNSLLNPHCQDDQRLVYLLEQAPTVSTHVDVCLYLIMGRLKPVDLEYMRYIHDLVNIIPVIIQPDLSVKMNQMTEQRLDMIQTLYQNQIKFCTFGFTQDEILSQCKEASLYCIPFVLNWSSTKPLFHGLAQIKQALFNVHLYHLRKQTNYRFIQWRHQQAVVVNDTSVCSSISTSSNSNLSTSSSVYSNLSTAEQQKISEYISKRRQQLDKELLLQEKRLKQEFQKLNQHKKKEYLLKELGLLQDQEKQDFEKLDKQKKKEYLLKELGFLQKQEKQTNRNLFILIAALLSCLCLLVVYKFLNKKYCLPS
ncbi:hypothetical protein G6F70_002675 [Rhizopus microsporus]|uniref:Septin-type G domain-containing protein n=1 Tax=Rhizopus microsporus TaxID=58291 RepID=A0A0A1N795_RHIZD|nr:hypothetical protein G6F71_002691 [Rhizopus microsporus]KAG1201968.1 hypothetical protein G6F70_002675 [Rhizopus microsporus]ORE19298.1 hypothetical protein BCV71DRAFT_177956 [Rhizopus microsporus]CEI88399.1 hypothetical protein RMCBS344292_02789 [Rhizopus microsporus]